jgi:hypothetical protein
LPAFRDLTGQDFNRWHVRKLGPRRGKHTLWECECRCGTVRDVLADSLTSGKSISCGCHKAEVTAARNFRHGLRRRPEWNVWQRMIQRCHNSANKSFRLYGGRGVYVCDRWRHDFAAFYADMGPRPSPRHEIDRVRNDGPYEPGNCRWVTHRVNCRNRRNQRLLAHAGETLCLSEWAERIGISPAALLSRIDRQGWSVERALSTPRLRRAPSR